MGKGGKDWKGMQEIHEFAWIWYVVYREMEGELIAKGLEHALHFQLANFPVLEVVKNMR